MQCPACWHENPAQAKFCLACGACLVVSCLNCRTELPPSAQCWLECGERVTPAGAAMVSPSTSPEEARTLLDPVLTPMMDAVHRYEGTGNQGMGDGIMALFGAPIAHEDHAVRACYAALRMQESVHRYAEEAWRAHGVTVQIRVGLHSGEVVGRAISNDRHLDYTAVGETTHLAARMEQAARPGTVLIAPATLDLGAGFVAVKSLGPVPVQGRREPVEVYELSGIGPERTRLQAAARCGRTRVVGRDAESEGLRRALEHTGAGHGQAVALVGEVGVGKSRLVWEFTRSHHTHGWLVLASGSVAYERATPYLPVIALLKAYLRLQERDNPRERRDRVTAKLLTVAHCHFGLGRLYAANGQREQARAELSTAVEMYWVMDMTFWLPQTEAALAQVDTR
jgi:class 3 adenylate cyclase